ncbi:MAG: tRNA (guanosine(37)-N1)-methyltransferase TrmD [Chloroflexi bacterium]|nr:tRNA (guanosine(37)-N1)-methyltransferase TrmD [Chloroflexota bacterium]
MQFDIFTLFPEIFPSYLSASILFRAQEMGHLQVEVHNIRDWATDNHQVTDEPPYGGGGGMVMKPEPIFAAVEDILGTPPDYPVILMTPQGELLDQAKAQELASQPRLGIIAGHYEGVDERVRQHLVTDEISIGDYVLTGGELPALVLVDVLTRLIPGVLGDPQAAANDSHASGLLEYPHYTRPEDFRDWKVPEILRSGHHARIIRWRRDQALKRTLERRPELLDDFDITKEDQDFLDTLSNPGE